MYGGKSSKRGHDIANDGEVNRLKAGKLLYMTFFVAVTISTSNIVHVLVCDCAFIVLLLFCFFILKFSFMLLCGISPSALRGLFKNSGVIYLVAVRSCCTCCSVLHKLTSSQQYDTLDNSTAMKCIVLCSAVLLLLLLCFIRVLSTEHLTSSWSLYVSMRTQRKNELN